jgi:hypothetical protein
MRFVSATKADREFARDIIDAKISDLERVRNIERVTDEEDGGEVVHICGELVTLDGAQGTFSIPEHWPEGATITWDPQ